MKIEEYQGSLNHRNKLPKDVKRAYITYKNQRTRCYNKKVRSYLDYGAKGIQVKYTVRSFVQWYLKEIKSFNGKNPTVGRIDHSKNYDFGNIEIQEKSENSKEAMQRTSHRFSKPVLVYERSSGIFIDRCKSINETAKKFGNSFSQVQRDCNDKVPNSKTKYRYKHEEIACAV